MVEISTHLIFISDPGHGWLRVPLKDIAALRIEEDISPYSFIDGRYAYHSAMLTTGLEEDCDYTVFVNACTAQEVPLPDMQNQYVDRFDRSQPGFGDPQFSSEFWNKLRR
ncbi:MAG: hypothetical protein GY805_04680 [Chloroflexi bacterium]|nr:hypothetical protein [Chloroflexota bacterium]